MFDPNILGNALRAMPQVPSEDAVKKNFSDCWVDYFYSSTISEIPIVRGSLMTAQAAMIKEMDGISIDGPKSTQRGVAAFWASVVATAPSIWLVAPNVISSITPPISISMIESSLLVLVNTNFLGSDIIDDIASILHQNGGVGGTATITTPSGVSSIVPIS